MLCCYTQYSKALKPAFCTSGCSRSLATHQAQGSWPADTGVVGQAPHTQRQGEPYLNMHNCRQSEYATSRAYIVIRSSTESVQCHTAHTRSATSTLSIPQHARSVAPATELAWRHLSFENLETVVGERFITYNHVIELLLQDYLIAEGYNGATTRGSHVTFESKYYFSQDGSRSVLIQGQTSGNTMHTKTSPSYYKQSAFVLCCHPVAMMKAWSCQAASGHQITVTSVEQLHLPAAMAASLLRCLQRS
jgi:hypothetical protein